MGQEYGNDVLLAGAPGDHATQFFQTQTQGTPPVGAYYDLDVAARAAQGKAFTVGTSIRPVDHKTGKVSGSSCIMVYAV